MADLPVITPTGAEAALRETVVEKLASTLRSKLLRFGDPDYEVARLVWNDLIDKRPALIARCAGVIDVIDSVDFTRENNLLLAVRRSHCRRQRRLRRRLRNRPLDNEEDTG